MLKAISAPRIFDGEHYYTDSALLWSKGQIEAIVPILDVPPHAEHQHFDDALIAPGFIDLQVNGGGGVMFNSDTSVEAIDAICKAHRRHGTAYLLPTLISETPTQLNHALNNTERAIELGIPGVLGVHLEGPWLNPDKKGAHDETRFYAPNVEQLEAMPWLKNGTTLVTLAPEKNTLNAMRWLKEHGIHLSCGHSNATTQQLTQEKLHCLDGYTHLFNAMSAFEGREPGVVGSALSQDSAWCSIITDGIHVHPQSVLLAYKAKPKGQLIIVTDAMATVGSDSPHFELDGEIISVVDNKLVNANGSLAGAHIGMDESVANVISWGIDEAEALKMASTYPAQALKQNNLGHFKKGATAAATILTSHYQTAGVMVDGQLFTD
ncbi:N-acetylglucosamine-6-phosphate deacetylase [Vibrio sp. TRT 17S01]|uniref:N-acetylglucosamine-6-phosphate deacetylase n=1 Tax=Vibrio sp. TRT 17S01 TaxID=3418505 RepID=UPI003CF3CB35